MIEGPRFGEVPRGDDFRRRPGAYGIAIRDDKVLLVRAHRNYFLPGGGRRRGEPGEAALLREISEETGHSVVACSLAAAAEQVVWLSDRSEWVVKECLFFQCDLGSESDGGAEDDHHALWVPLTEAPGLLAEAASAWAVTMVAENRRADGAAEA